MEKEENALSETQHHRFRQTSDVTHFLIRFWRMCEGDFYSRNSKGKYFSINGFETAELASKAISERKYPEICLNDCYEGDDFDLIRDKINHAFEEILSEKCEFEIYICWVGCVMNKRILIVSNECFEKSSSNGRTLMSFMRRIGPENLAQFYIHGNPDFSVCKNYYCVSDRDALNASKSIKAYKKSGLIRVMPEDVFDSEKNNKNVNSAKKIKKNCRNCFLRYLVWRTYRWWNKEFEAFIDGFKPQVVLLQAGDAPFMYAIARRIANRMNVPLVMYNSENYVLKKKMYNGVNDKSLWHKLLKSALKKEYLNFMKEVSYCIYSTEYLEKCYQEWYPHSGKSTYIYISSLIASCDSIDENEQDFTLLYCGNLGVGRVESLCSLADVLNRVSSSAKLVICGGFVDDNDKRMLCNKGNVIYKGVISYDQVAIEISQSSMVVHCENPDRLDDLENAFSTKIADSLDCGKPFLVYALHKYPFVQYLLKNNCAHIAENSEELEDVLCNCISDENYLYKYVANAKTVASKNHSMEINSKKFEELIEQL